MSRRSSTEGSADQALVSIITPTLNQGRFIEETLRSVMGQTYPNIEHIVVDAGSTDDTLTILRRYEGRYGLRWTSRPDDGMYDGLNQGLRRSEGSIVAYLNSDDLLLPWAVEVAVSRLEADPRLGLAYGDALQIDDATGALRLFFQPRFHRRYLETIGSFAQPATFWRREVHDEVGVFDSRLQYAGDLDFYLRVADRFAIGRIDEFLAIMRLHPQMKTRAQAAASRAENHLVRTRRGIALTARMVGQQRFRAWLERRRLWLGFAAARGHRWRRFSAAGEVRISLPRFVLAQVPAIGARVPEVTSTEVDWIRLAAGSIPAARRG